MGLPRDGGIEEINIEAPFRYQGIDNEDEAHKEEAVGVEQNGFGAPKAFRRDSPENVKVEAR